LYIWYSNKDLSGLGYPAVTPLTALSHCVVRRRVGVILKGWPRAKRPLDVSHVDLLYKVVKDIFCPYFFGTFLRKLKSLIFHT
jgi:hypothetical protein